MMDGIGYDPRYLQGIEHFNQCDFFEAHEVWEDLWADQTGDSRRFYQGLIQAAVALYHFGNGNIRGARKVFHGSCGYLEPLRPRYQGLDVEKFVAQMRQCFAEVASSSEDYPQIELVTELIPEIRLDPPAGAAAT